MTSGKANRRHVLDNCDARLPGADQLDGSCKQRVARIFASTPSNSGEALAGRAGEEHIKAPHIQLWCRCSDIGDDSTVPMIFGVGFNGIGVVVISARAPVAHVVEAGIQTAAAGKEAYKGGLCQLEERL